MVKPLTTPDDNFADRCDSWIEGHCGGKPLTKEQQEILRETFYAGAWCMASLITRDSKGITFQQLKDRIDGFYDNQLLPVVRKFTGNPLLGLDR